jgi:guanylate kinase
MNELVTQELDTVHLDASSHQSIDRRMKTYVTTESKKKKKKIKKKKKKLREKKLFEHLSCNGSNDKNRTATQTVSNRTDPTFPCMF